MVGVAVVGAEDGAKVGGLDGAPVGEAVGAEEGADVAAVAVETSAIRQTNRHALEGQV